MFAADPSVASPRRAYLYADPAAHSLSPLMHRAAFAAAGLSGEYEAVRVLSADLPEMVARLRDSQTLGANLSLPHKESALPLLDSLSSAAQAIGAVNTIIHRGGHLLGTNTDAPGLLAALKDAGMLEDAQSVVILGAGGAARAATYAARTVLGAEVYIVNRTGERARTLAAEFGVRAAALSQVPWSEVKLILNCSSAGLNAPDETPLPQFDFSGCAQAAVYDMVYKPAETRLLREARAAGLKAENGLGMLAHQARLAFYEWTGAKVPVEVFLGALAGAKAEHEAGAGAKAGAGRAL